MRSALPSRFASRNSACATAAPAAYFLVAARLTGDRDSLDVLLRGDLEGMDLQDARQHAGSVLDRLTMQHRGKFLQVQVLDGNNLPVYVCAGGVL